MRSTAVRSRHRAPFALLLSPALLYVYLPTFTWLGGQWLGAGLFSHRARDWSHGPLVLVLIGYLLWRRRQEFSPTGASLWGVPLILGGVGLWVASGFAQAPYLSAYSLIPVCLGLAVLFFGSRTGYRLLVPFLLFLLAVPFPATEWGITGFLAQIVAISSAFLSRLAGAPVFRSGQLITVGQAEYLVEPLCSGFNLIMALLALVVPLLYLQGASLKSLGVALLWVSALGMVTKVALASTIVVLTPWVGQDTALSLYHGWLGILFYLAGLGFAVLTITFAAAKSHLGSSPLPQSR